MTDHRDIDARSLAFGRLIAERVRSQPELIDRAKATLARWMLTCSPRVRSTFEEWSTALNGPVQGVVDLLSGTDERSIRLRQSNPFAGVLSNAERNAVIRQFQSHDSPTA